MMAVILAAGQGTRLRPYTADQPKPLVKLNGKSLLARTSETLQTVGIDDQLIVTGYCADKIVTRGYETVRNEEFDSTEMVHSLFTAVEAIPRDEDLIVSYGDILYESDLVAQLVACDAPICVLIDTEWRDQWEARFAEPLQDAETLTLDSNGYITEIGGHPDDYHEIEGQYIGLIKIRADMIDSLIAGYEQLLANASTADSAREMDMTSLLQHLINSDWDIKAVPVKRGWIEIDTAKDLEMFRRLAEQGRLERFIHID